MELAKRRSILSEEKINSFNGLNYITALYLNDYGTQKQKEEFALLSDEDLITVRVTSSDPIDILESVLYSTTQHIGSTLINSFRACNKEELLKFCEKTLAFSDLNIVFEIEGTMYATVEVFPF